MAAGRIWTRPEQLQILRLYMRLPFGQLDQRNRHIIALARRINRTPGAVSMKACNFASLDEAITRTGRKGLSGASNSDRQLWADFLANPEAIAAEAEAAARTPTADSNDIGALRSASTETEVVQTVRARRVQSFFRAAVLTSYDFRCAITGLGDPRLLNASHIIPWSVNTARRADPTNGLCLNALLDRAFDRGLLTLDENLKVVLSDQLRLVARDSELRCSLLECEGRRLLLPTRFEPDVAALQYHRDQVFQAE